MKEKSNSFEMHTVRKKVFMLSKLMGGLIVLFYLLTEQLPVGQSIAFWIWLALLIVIILGVDRILGKLISDPLHRINDAARQMAGLDFSAKCDVAANDEFGELSQSLNTMFSNLQEAFGKLEAANARLEEDVKKERILLEQRKDLSDSLSHEMKTPLGLIRAYTEGLHDETNPEKRNAYIHAILDATKRMDNLIVSLLDLSALEAGAAALTEERFDFVELTETVAGRLLMDTPGTDFTLKYDLPDGKIFVYADKGRMEQVLGNLIENARQNVLVNGSIMLTVHQESSHLYFSIFNSARHIDEQELPKIWEKFYRGSGQKYKGSGLGLAIAAQILSMYHAPYEARSLDDGLEISFRFPTVR